MVKGSNNSSNSNPTGKPFGSADAFSPSNLPKRNPNYGQSNSNSNSNGSSNPGGGNGQFDNDLKGTKNPKSQSEGYKSSIWDIKGQNLQNLIVRKKNNKIFGN